MQPSRQSPCRKGKVLVKLLRETSLVVVESLGFPSMLQPCLRWGSKHPAGSTGSCRQPGQCGETIAGFLSTHVWRIISISAARNKLYYAGRALAICCSIFYFFFFLLSFFFPPSLLPSFSLPFSFVSSVVLTSLLSLFRAIAVCVPRRRPGPPSTWSCHALAASIRLCHPFGHLPPSLASHSSCHHSCLCDSDSLLPSCSSSLT